MKKRILFIVSLFLFAFLFVFLSLFNEWELSHETWGYWFFARIFAETGKLVLMQRSPLYVIYLGLYGSLSYPQNIIAEYVCTTFITVISLSFLLVPYFGLALSFFASILWIPYLTTSEPPVQKLALAMCCWALLCRRGTVSHFKRSLSYSFLILAYMFRPTYLFLVPFFVVYDLFKIKERNNFKLSRFIPRFRKDWPLMGVLSLWIVLTVFQSPHRWNNVFFASSEWFPHNGKSEEIIQNYNRSYIQKQYGTFENHDFYNTNEELFHGAKNTYEAFRNNPVHVISQAIEYAYYSVGMVIQFTVFAFYSENIYISGSIFFLIIIGAALGARKSELLIFASGSFFMFMISVVFMPQYRYLIFPFIPLFIFSAYGYAEILSGNRYRKYLFFPLSVFFLLIFSPTLTDVNYYNRTHLGWITLMNSIVHRVQNHSLKILELNSNSYVSSPKASYLKISDVLKDCRGVMTLEYAFLGAFTKIPVNRIYDIWEIPPFGKLGDLTYNGLNPNRIDCLLVSREFVLYPGEGTNSKLRYENYILPYMEKLKLLGATVINIPSFGTAVVLN